MLRLAPPNKRRPVLVVSRQALLDVLHTATVAAITSQRRGSPTEVDVGVDEGLRVDSCVSLANLFTVRQADLHHYVGSLGPAKLGAVCEALAIAHCCD